jgi:hypothetical protein
MESIHSAELGYNIINEKTIHMDMVHIRLVVREGESRDDGGEHAPPSSGGGYVPRAEIGPAMCSTNGSAYRSWR